MARLSQQAGNSPDTEHICVCICWIQCVMYRGGGGHLFLFKQHKELGSKLAKHALKTKTGFFREYNYLLSCQLPAWMSFKSVSQNQGPAAQFKKWDGNINVWLGSVFNIVAWLCSPRSDWIIWEQETPTLTDNLIHVVPNIAARTNKAIVYNISYPS